MLQIPVVAALPAGRAEPAGPRGQRPGVDPRRADLAANSRDARRTWRCSRAEGRGPLTSNGVETGGFIRTTDGLPAPDMQFHAAPVIVAGPAGATNTGSRSRCAREAGEPRRAHPPLRRSDDGAVHPAQLPRRGVRHARPCRTACASQRISPRSRRSRHHSRPFEGPASYSEQDLTEYLRGQTYSSFTPSALVAWAPTTRPC